MENAPIQPGHNSSASEKPPRSKLERAIVWTVIGLLVVFAGVEALAKFGYEKTITNLQEATGSATEPLTLDDFHSDLKSGLPIQGTGESNGRQTILFTWPSLVKEYDLHLTVSADGNQTLQTFSTGTDPAEFIRYRSPDEEGAEPSDTDMAMAGGGPGARSEGGRSGGPGGGGPGGGGPGGGGPGGGRGGRNPLQSLLSDAVVAELQLSDEQKTKLTEIIGSLQMEPMISAEERAKREALQRKDVEEKMKEFLDDKQVARAKQIVLHARGPEALGDEEVATALALTPEQQDEIAKIIASQREKRQEINQAERAERGALMSALREETNASLLAVLTDDQKKAWETLLGPAPPEPTARPQRPE
jgi:hypothetical protein